MRQPRQRGILHVRPRSVFLLSGCRVHIRIGPRRLEGVGGISIETFGDVTLHVEEGLDRDVSEPGCDDGGVGSLPDEEGDVARTKVMNSHWWAD